MHELGNLVAIFRKADVNCIGIAKQVVKIAEYLLICAGEENSDDVLLTVGERVQRQTWSRSSLPDESLDLAVRIASNVLNRSVSRRLLVQTVNRHHGKELVDRPAVRQRLKER